MDMEAPSIMEHSEAGTETGCRRGSHSSGLVTRFPSGMELILLEVGLLIFCTRRCRVVLLTKRADGTILTAVKTAVTIFEGVTCPIER